MSDGARIGDATGNLRNGNFSFLHKVCEPNPLSSTRKDEPLPFGPVIASPMSRRQDTKGGSDSSQSLSSRRAGNTFAI